MEKGVEERNKIRSYYVPFVAKKAQYTQGCPRYERLKQTQIATCKLLIILWKLYMSFAI